jgi:hypothetical protein
MSCASRLVTVCGCNDFSEHRQDRIRAIWRKPIALIVCHGPGALAYDFVLEILAGKKFEVLPDEAAANRSAIEIDTNIGQDD